MPAVITARRLMNSTGPMRSGRSERWRSIWRHWRPKPDRKRRRNAAMAMAQKVDESLALIASRRLPFLSNPFATKIRNTQGVEKSLPEFSCKSSKFRKTVIQKRQIQIPRLTDAAQSQIPIDLHPARTRQYQVF